MGADDGGCRRFTADGRSRFAPMQAVRRPRGAWSVDAAQGQSADRTVWAAGDYALVE